MTATLLTATAAAYAVASAFFLAWLVRYEPANRNTGAALTMVATAMLGGAAALELGLGDPVLKPGPQILLVVTFGICLLFLVTRLRRDTPLAGPVVAPLAAAITLVLTVKAMRGDLPSSAGSLGAITVIHIGATMLGFLCFIPAYVLSVLFLHQQYQLKARKLPGSGALPSLLKLEDMAWRLLYVGFPLYSVGILLGFVWQERAAIGHASLLRPEHLLSAASWCIFAYATYRRLKSGWRGRRAALAVMAAFVLTLAAVLLYVMR